MERDGLDNYFKKIGPEKQRKNACGVKASDKDRLTGWDEREKYVSAYSDHSRPLQKKGRRAFGAEGA